MTRAELIRSEGQVGRHGRDSEFMSSEIMGEFYRGNLEGKIRGWRDVSDGCEADGRGKGTKVLDFRATKEIDHKEERRVRIQSSSRPDPDRGRGGKS